jgi:hypothetical protein
VASTTRIAEPHSTGGQAKRPGQLIGVVFFGVLAGSAPTISADLAPELRARLVGALPESAVTTTVADFQRCAEDRARSRDPADPPASCQVATLGATDPAVAPVIADISRRANALTYARAYAVALFCCVAALLVAFLAGLAFPAPARPQRVELQPPD